MMKNRILIGNSEFVSDKFGDYIGKLTIWGRETIVILDINDDKDEVTDTVIKKISWLNNNRYKVVEAFMKENYHYVDFINKMIESGDFKADEQISEEQFTKALFVSGVTIFISGRNSEFSLDMDAEPDYLLGHLACMEIDSQYEVEFGGLNG